MPLKRPFVKLLSRAFLYSSGVCFAGAALMAFFAIGAFANASAAAGWWLIAGGGVLAVVGIQVHNSIREESDAARVAISKASLLEARVEQQRMAVDSLADGLDVAVFICDARANVIYANRRAVAMFNFSEPVGRSLLAITLSYDLERLVVEAAQKQEVQHGEIVFSYPSEHVGQAKAWTSEHERNRVFLSIYEITDLRRLERVRKDFVANVSHELRTPLTIIRAKAENMLDEVESDSIKADLRRIIDEVDRLSMITQDLLVLSTAESNPIRKHATDIAAVVSGVVSQLSEKAEQRGLAIEYHGPAHLMMEANTSQMTQVVFNLVDNAINYTPTGTVDVSLIEEGESAVLEISDTGIGIASEHLPRIFERFYRVDKARSRSTGGTGLGLSIVKHIVEAHGGSVNVDSALNRGTTFTVSLPVGNPTVAEPKS